MEDPKVLVIYTLIGIPFIILALVFVLLKIRNIAPIAILILQISAWMILMGGSCVFLVRCFQSGFGPRGMIQELFNLFSSIVIWALLIVISNTAAMIQELHDSWQKNQQNLSL